MPQKCRFTHFRMQLPPGIQHLPQNFQLECNKNSKNKSQLQALLLYILHARENASQYEHILKHSHFLVALPPFSSDISETNKDRRENFGNVIFSISGHIWLNLSKIGD